MSVGVFLNLRVSDVEFVFFSFKIRLRNLFSLDRVPGQYAGRTQLYVVLEEEEGQQSD